MSYSDDPKPELEDVLVQAIEESIRDDIAQGATAPKAPEEVFVMPLLRRPFFPGMAAPLMIEPGRFYEVLKIVAKSSHKSLGLFLAKDEDASIYTVCVNDLYSVGVLARILRIIPMEQGGAQVVLSMERRILLKQGVEDSKFLKAKIEVVEDVSDHLSEELKAYSISIITTIKELLKLNPLFKEELQIFLGHSDFTEPGKLADFAVALTTATREELQDVLEAFDLQQRIDKALVLLKKELDLSKLQNTINLKIETSISKTQREFFLKEQLKTIKKELGLEKEDKACELDKFRERLKLRTVPDDVMGVIKEEMEKLQSLEMQSAEYSVCRNYLDWLTIVPWGIQSQDRLDLRFAERVLCEDHYGLKDIKERVLEYISVGKLSHGVKGNIIGLIGPPGVGKTSVGKSIARALGKKFYRFSVGGMRDEAEIKGHRRTYVGAMPGKLVQALKYAEVMNPVIMLDEIDKIGRSYHGDPASSLLEVLDPEQNKNFLDHYLDVRCDLSNVLFIVTGNVLESIPEPLIDRMEVMRLSGYILEEKLMIASRYLVPKNRKHMGLLSGQAMFTDAALKALITGYAREAGVRSLDNYIKKILRKVAYQLVSKEEMRKNESEEEAEQVKEESAKVETKKKMVRTTISEKSLVTFLGKPVFTSDRYYDRTPVGVCMGLAWTAMGGATLYVETIAIPGEKTSMKLTGHAGEVMKESSQIAWTYVHAHAKNYAPQATFFEKTEVHLHIPEGATPKDGPSAGITMVTALVSLLRNEPVKEEVGMTGELTLTGKVLPIGGVKEKFIAGKRSGLKTLIFPKDNQRDYDELPDYVKKDMRVLFVSHYDEVFHEVFRDL